MSQIFSRIYKARLAYLFLAVLLVIGGLFYISHAYGASMQLRSLLLSNGAPGANATYRLSFTIPSPEILGAIKIEFCANDPLLTDPCTIPAGLDVSAVVLSAQTGVSNFTIDHTATNANTIVITRTPNTIAMATPVSFTFTNATNPSTVGSYYGRVQTFSGSDTSGPENEHGGLAFGINSSVQISTTVPPYLLFCGGVTIPAMDCDTASGNYINFGNFTSASTSSAQSQLLTATNAQNGFQIQVYGSTMTSGNNIISAMFPRNVSKPGTSQFGLNLAANHTPVVGAAPQGPGTATATSNYGLPDWFEFASGSTLASVSHVDSYRRFTISYIVNIPNGQTPGVYVATLTYVCLANF